MSPEKQRIAIAEACPNIHDFGSYLPSKDEWGTDVWNPVWRYFNGRQWRDCLNNDPLSDLNAMHEAEKMMTDEQMQQATFRLWEIVLTEDGDVSAEFTPGAWITVDLAAKVQRATAAQRAEAFLRTLNLWTD